LSIGYGTFYLKDVLFQLSTLKNKEIKMPRTITFEEFPGTCNLANEYIQKHSTTPPKVAVVACEGSCLRGEITRRAANIVNYKLLPDKTVRVCFQGIVAGGCPEGALIEQAEDVLFMEGCGLKCASRMVRGAMDINAKVDVVITDGLCDFDKKFFAVTELPEEEIQAQAEKVAKSIITRLT
jgi:uncharacterized metal-binding protein